jgi:hypothetical protein
MPDLAAIVWHLDTHAPVWLTDADLFAVTAWMDDNAMRGSTADRPVDVRDGQITYGRDYSGPTVRSPHRDIRTTVVPLRTAPPDVWQPDCDPAALRCVQAVIAEHEWTPAFDGSCVDCSTTWMDGDRIMCRREDAVSYPCLPVRRALAEAGLPVPAPDDGQLLRVLGDCLDPVTNALAFGQP